MFEGFIGGAALYLKYTGDHADGTALYDEYELSDVLVREKLAYSERGVEHGETVLYFITKKSTCYGADGEVCQLPKPREYDLCTLRAGTDDEITRRVAEAGYFIGRGDIEYVRLKLV